MVRIAAWCLGVLLWVGLTLSPAQVSSAQALELNPGNSAVKTITLPIPAETSVALVQQAFQVWPRGELLKTRYDDRDPAGPHWVVKGLSRTKVFRFTDDIEVDISRDPQQGNQSQLVLTSVGRQGEYDFGGNGRNLSELVATLDGLRSAAAGT